MRGFFFKLCEAITFLLVKGFEALKGERISSVRTGAGCNMKWGGKLRISLLYP